MAGTDPTEEDAPEYVGRAFYLRGKRCIAQAATRVTRDGEPVIRLEFEDHAPMPVHELPESAIRDGSDAIGDG